MTQNEVETLLTSWLPPEVIEAIGTYVATYVGTGILLGMLVGAVGFVVTYIANVMRGGT